MKLVKLNERQINIVNKINDFKNPSSIYIPILKDVTFNMNEYVYKNTYFDGYISSISGYIKGSKKVLIKNKLVPAIEIENDFKENIKSKNKFVNGSKQMTPMARSFLMSPNSES